MSSTDPGFSPAPENDPHVVSTPTISPSCSSTPPFIHSDPFSTTIEQQEQIYNDFLLTLHHWFTHPPRIIQGQTSRFEISDHEIPIFNSQAIYWIIQIAETLEYTQPSGAGRDMINVEKYFGPAIDIFLQVANLQDLPSSCEELCVSALGSMFQYISHQQLYHIAQFTQLYDFLRSRTQPRTYSFLINLRAYSFINRAIPNNKEAFQFYQLDINNEFFHNLELHAKINIPIVLSNTLPPQHNLGIVGYGDHEGKQLTNQQAHILATQISNYAPSDPILQRLSLLRYIVEWLNILCNFHPDSIQLLSRWFPLLSSIFDCAVTYMNTYNAESRLLWLLIVQSLVTWKTFYNVSTFNYELLSTDAKYTIHPTARACRAMNGLGQLSNAARVSQQFNEAFTQTPAVRSSQMDAELLLSTSQINTFNVHGSPEMIQRVKQSYTYAIEKLQGEESTNSFISIILSIMLKLIDKKTIQNKVLPQLTCHRAVDSIIELLYIIAPYCTPSLLTPTSLQSIVNVMKYTINIPAYETIDQINVINIFKLLELLYIMQNTSQLVIKVINLYKETGVYQEIFKFVKDFDSFLKSKPCMRCPESQYNPNDNNDCIQFSNIPSTSPSLSLSSSSSSSTAYQQQSPEDESFQNYVLNVSTALSSLLVTSTSVHHCVCIDYKCTGESHDHNCEWYYRTIANPTSTQNTTHGQISKEVLKLQLDLFFKWNIHKHFFPILLKTCIAGKIPYPTVELLSGILDITNLCSFLIDRPQELPGAYTIHEVYTLYSDIITATISTFCLYHLAGSEEAAATLAYLTALQQRHVKAGEDDGDEYDANNNELLLLRHNSSPPVAQINNSSNSNMLIPPTPVGPAALSSSPVSLTTTPLSCQALSAVTLDDKLKQYYKPFDPLSDDVSEYLNYSSFLSSYYSTNTSSTTSMLKPSHNNNGNGSGNNNEEAMSSMLYSPPNVYKMAANMVYIHGKPYSTEEQYQVVPAGSIKPVTSYLIHPNFPEYYGISSPFYRTTQMVGQIVDLVINIHKKFRRVVKNNPNLLKKTLTDYSTWVEVWKEHEEKRLLSLQKNRKQISSSSSSLSSSTGSSTGKESKNVFTSAMSNIPFVMNISSWYNGLSSQTQQLVSIASVAIPVVTFAAWFFFKRGKTADEKQSAERLSKIQSSFQAQSQFESVLSEVIISAEETALGAPPQQEVIIKEIQEPVLDAATIVAVAQPELVTPIEIEATSIVSANDNLDTISISTDMLMNENIDTVPEFADSSDVQSVLSSTDDFVEVFKQNYDPLSIQSDDFFVPEVTSHQEIDDVIDTDVNGVVAVDDESIDPYEQISPSQVQSIDPYEQISPNEVQSDLNSVFGASSIDESPAFDENVISETLSEIAVSDILSILDTQEIVQPIGGFDNETPISGLDIEVVSDLDIDVVSDLDVNVLTHVDTPVQLFEQLDNNITHLQQNDEILVINNPIVDNSSV